MVDGDNEPAPCKVTLRSSQFGAAAGLPRNLLGVAALEVDVEQETWRNLKSCNSHP